MGGGGSLTQLAQNILTNLGGAAGGYMLAAAITVVGILAYCHAVTGHTFRNTVILGCFTWLATWIVSSVIGWV